MKTGAALFLIFVSACFYAWQDAALTTQAYAWGTIYVVIICLEIVRRGYIASSYCGATHARNSELILRVCPPVIQVYVKDVISKIDCDNWTLVWYNNSLSWFFSLAVLATTHKPTRELLSVQAVVGIAVSCLFGTFALVRLADVFALTVFFTAPAQALA